MAKFHGVLGFIINTETAPGIYTPSVTERVCTGNILRNTRDWQSGLSVNDNFTIDNRFSVIGDEFAYQNLTYLTYIVWMGIKWKVTSVEIERPNMVIRVNGVYNG